MDKDLYGKYEAVLADQQEERDRLAAELHQVDLIIAKLKAKLEVRDTELRSAAKALPFPTPLGLGANPEVPPSLWYAGISVRWAILSLMADHSTEPMATADIATALKDGGVRSGGQSFVANVSAVVSDMVHKRGELLAAEGKYQITPSGRSAWESIKHSRSYRFRRMGFGGDMAAKA